MSNPYYSIVELTEQFEKLSNDDLKKIDTRVVCKLLLVIAQQLSVVSGRLADINKTLELVAVSSTPVNGGKKK